VRTVEKYNSQPVILDTLGINIEKYWKDNASSVGTSASAIANGLHRALKNVYAGFDLAFVVWKDWEHGDYHHFLPGGGSYVRTRDFNRDAANKWVILGVVSPKLVPSTTAFLKQQVDKILEPQFKLAESLSKTKKNAGEILTELTNSASWKANPPKGLVVTWRPSGDQIAVGTDSLPVSNGTPS